MGPNVYISSSSSNVALLVWAVAAANCARQAAELCTHGTAGGQSYAEAASVQGMVSAGQLATSALHSQPYQVAAAAAAYQVYQPRVCMLSPGYQ